MWAYRTVLLARQMAIGILVGYIFTEVLALIDFKLRGWGFFEQTLTTRAKLGLIRSGSLEPQLQLSRALYTNPINWPGFARMFPELLQNLSMNLLGTGGGVGKEWEQGCRLWGGLQGNLKPGELPRLSLSSGWTPTDIFHFEAELELTNPLTSLTHLLTSSKSQLDLLLNTVLWHKSSVSFCKWMGSKSRS